jgi:hypothetical protein
MNAKPDPTSADDAWPPRNAAELLHEPGRLNSLRPIDEHLLAAASLARALWLLLASEQESIGQRDARNINALTALASAVADHASAADYLYTSTGHRP